MRRNFVSFHGQGSSPPATALNDSCLKCLLLGASSVRHVPPCLPVTRRCLLLHIPVLSRHRILRRVGRHTPIYDCHTHHAGDDHTLREKFSESQSAKPTLTGAAKQQTLLPTGTDTAKAKPTLASTSEDIPSKPTLSGAAKGVPMQPSASGFSPFAALAGTAMDTADDDGLEVGMVHERVPTAED